jgi:hypothetical protein
MGGPNPFAIAVNHRVTGELEDCCIVMIDANVHFSSVSAAYHLGSDRRIADMDGPAAGSIPVANDRAAKLAAIPAGESPANRDAMGRRRGYCIHRR